MPLNDIGSVQIQPRLNESLKFTGEFLVVWPQESYRLLGGRSVWPSSFKPTNGLSGKIIHSWTPFHAKREFRSHSGYIYLLSVQHESSRLYIPILKEGVRLLNKSPEQYDDLEASL